MDKQEMPVNEYEDDETLFDPKLLETIRLEDWEHVKFDKHISAQCPGNGLWLRPLKSTDFAKGFPGVLSQLTVVGSVSEERYLKTFNVMKNTPGTYYIAVIEDMNTGNIMGSSTLLIEQKFIHECAKRGRIEDLVVNDAYRGKQLGKLLIVVMILLSKQLGCYKLSLDCRDAMIPFYTSLGLNKEPENANFMTVRF